jgi:hypothetical protein
MGREISDVRRRDGDSNSPLTYIVKEMLKLVERIDPSIQAIVMLDQNGESGMGFHGFASDDDALTSILAHTEALLKTSGRTMVVQVVHRKPPSA